MENLLLLILAAVGIFAGLVNALSDIGCLLGGFVNIGC